VPVPRRPPERRPGRALLVAEAPCRGRNRTPLDGGAGDRLARHAGLADRSELLEAFDAWNLLGRWPGGAGKGSRWPAERARRAAARHPLRGVVVLLGGRVARAYGMHRLALWRFHELPRARGLVAVIAHPSGVVRTYNEERHRMAAGRVLWCAERLARGLPGVDSGAIVGAVPEREEDEA
jgi:hypothetical protein